MVEKKRKFLSVRERALNQSDIRKVPQKVLNRGERRLKAEAITRYNTQVSQEAQRLNKQLESIQYGGSVANYTKQYNEIKRNNPDVAAKLKFNPNTIQKEVDRRKSELKQLLDKSDKSESKARKKGDRPRRKGEQAFQKGIKEGLSLLNQGNLISVSEVRSFANKLERNARKKAKVGAFNQKRINSDAKLLFFAQEILKKEKAKKKVKLSPERLLFFAQEISKKNKNLKAKQAARQILKVELPKAPKAQQLSFAKVATQTTLTPEDKKQIQKLVKNENAQINKRQLEILKNAPKDVFTGVKEVGKEVIDLGVGSIKASFNYGRDLVKRSDSGEDKPLINDIQKLALGTLSAVTFIKNNPGKSASIVGAAVASGGSQFKTAFIKNPIKTLTKSALYLFPGTVIKGGVKGTKAVVGTIKTTKQAINLKKIQNKLKVLEGAKLTGKQIKTLEKATIRASKVNNVKKQDTILRNVLRPIAKARDLSVKRGQSISSLAKGITGQRDIVKVISVKKVPKKAPKLKKGEVRATIIKPKPKKTRKTITKVVVKGKKAKKVTAKEFKQAQPKKKPGRPKTEKKPVKLIDVTKEAEVLLKREIAKKGIVKKGKTTFIDLNAVSRIENAKKPVKVIKLTSLRNSKSGSLRFNRQVQVQIQRYEKISKPKKRVPKKKLKQVKKKLIKLKTIVRIAKLAGTAALIASIVSIEGAIDNKIKQTPVQGQPQKSAQTQPQTPVQGQPQKKAGGQLKAQTPKFKTPLKGKTILKQIKKTRSLKKKPSKPLKKLKLPDLNFNSKLPAGSRLSFDLRYREKGKIKTKKLGLPLNRAIKRGFGAVDKTTQASAQLVISGLTKSKDIAASQVNRIKSKFRVKKSSTSKALLFVEKTKNRIDTRGEKKGLSLSKALKTKKKSKKKVIKKKKTSKKNKK